MKAKKMLMVALLSLFVFGCNKVYDQNDIIDKLKSYDNTSPYTYTSTFENDTGYINYNFSYNEGTKEFTCFYRNYSYYEDIQRIYESSVTITWSWGDLDDAVVYSDFHDSDINCGGIVRMKISDLVFGQFPSVIDFDYKITYDSSRSETNFISAKANAQMDINFALRRTNDFCTSIDGSLSIR